MAVRFDLTLFVTLLLLVCAAAHGEDAVSRPHDVEQLEFFEKKIRPVLVKHCYECHAADAKKIRGGLLLDTREGSRLGGDSGPAVVPGEPDESLILGAIRYDDFEMPPSGKLPGDVIADFEKWIVAGAYDPRAGKVIQREAGIDLDHGRHHWSFQPLATVDVPGISDLAWPRTAIDHFVLARLEASDISPAPDCEPAALIRRAKFDLIGLPPTPEEIRTFIIDPSHEHFAEIVDAWLMSPHFGERWGRHWLDVTRFAESSGGGRSLMFPHAWRFRDYAIEAFNDDRPFDQLIREQIAGDLMTAHTQLERDQQIVATGFLALGPTNYELQDKELLDFEVVDEQIDTIGRAFLGLTLGCARCHDHKFDPVPTTDYYALAGILISTETVVHSNVSNPVLQNLPSDPQWELFQQKKATLAALQSQIKKLKDDKPAPLQLGPDVVSVEVDNVDAKFVGEWTESTSVPGFVGNNYAHDNNKELGEKSATFEAVLPEPGKYDVWVSHTSGTNRATNVGVTLEHAGGQAHAKINQQKAPELLKTYVSVGIFEFDKKTVRLVIHNDGADGVVIADAVRWVRADAVFDAQQTQQLSIINGRREQLAKLEKELAAIKKSTPGEPQAMSVRDRESATDMQVRIRGEIRNLGPMVPRGFVSVATPRPPKLTAATSGRRELADWIASPDNPLTARVYVNRVWHNLFGAGLVRTPDNFGLMGQKPTHPELIDFLANRFVENGWSTKQLIREIMLSRVYRLSSIATADVTQRDPDNRLHSHANRRRLDAESIRDAMLFVSDELDFSAGGLTISKLTQYDVVYDFRSHRRSVFVPRFRNAVLDLFQVFDVANPNLVTGQRTASVLPAQALYLSNSPFVRDRTHAAAKRVLNEDDSFSNRLDEAFLGTLGREPTEEESRLFERFLAESAAESGSGSEESAWATVYHMLVQSLDFRYLD